jgi:hypothetical protein
MSILLRAAIAALSVTSISPAIAGEGEGPIANTRFAQLVGVIAEVPVASGSLAALSRDGEPSSTYLTQSGDVLSPSPSYNGAGGRR